MTLILLFLGCFGSEPCEQTCDTLYSEDACHIGRPGQSQEELIDLCVASCGSAWQMSGDVGDYDPYAQTSPTQSVELENRAMVELWAQCIADSSCDDLDDGYCAPVW